MHSAPSVSYPVGRSRNAARILMIIWAAGAGAAGAWRYQINSNLGVGDWRQWLLLAAVVLAGLGLWSALRAQPVGELRWDGQYWTLKAGLAERGGALAGVHLDLQTLMLVHLVPADGRAQWLWLERGAAPERWRELRRALYSRAPLPESWRANSEPTA